MIKFENTDAYGWESAIRGMRNPMNSWDKSDSHYGCGEDGVCSKCSAYGCHDDGRIYIIGPNDLELMNKLVKAGSDHSKFMRMINVTVDITAPLYWWKEFDTYKVGTVRNSCSTMHKIHDKPFELDDFSHDQLFDMRSWSSIPDNARYGCNSMTALKAIVDLLNSLRTNYINTQNKMYWYAMIQLLPSSYNQRATVQLNYQVLWSMYHGRDHHKLDEWREGFCEWVKSLPYSELITE